LPVREFTAPRPAPDRITRCGLRAVFIHPTITATSADDALSQATSRAQMKRNQRNRSKA
jgi:hypothetical protein